MTYKELLEETKGMRLSSYRIYLGERSNWTESVSLYRDGDEWVMQTIDERQQTWCKRGPEEKMCELMYITIMTWIKR